MLLKLLTIIDPCETNRKISFSGIDGNTGKDIAITKAKLNNYTRTSPKRLSPDVKVSIILRELQIDNEAIENKNIPLKYYNYSYVKDRLIKVYHHS